MKARKPYGVWMLLQDKTPWMFCREATLIEALLTARTLRLAGSPLPPSHAVWIAPPVQIRRQGER